MSELFRYLFHDFFCIISLALHSHILKTFLLYNILMMVHKLSSPSLHWSSFNFQSFFPSFPVFDLFLLRHYIFYMFIRVLQQLLYHDFSRYSEQNPAVYMFIFLLCPLLCFHSIMLLY